MVVVEIVFWVCVALLVHTHVTYPLSLALLTRIRRPRAAREVSSGELPAVSLIVAAHDEDAVIERRVRNALESDYPRERLDVIVTSDGSDDRTVELARTAGADQVLDLSRRGKVEAQNAAVGSARGDVLAFSDANSFWRPDALRRLVDRLADPEVGYVCGQVTFTDAHGVNQEGAYWRYEMAVRGLESELASVTAGNGAIYAVRRDAYVEMPSDRGHDLCLPYLMVRMGLRAVYEPAARADELMAPTMSGEWERKRRMMNRTWGVLLHDRMLSPRGYGPLYAYEMLSHRALRYASPFLHLLAFAANLGLLRRGPLYRLALAAQLGLVGAAAKGARIPRYYVLITASQALGLWDWLRTGTPAGWEKAEGTR